MTVPPWKSAIQPSPSGFGGSQELTIFWGPPCKTYHAPIILADHGVPAKFRWPHGSQVIASRMEFLTIVTARRGHRLDSYNVAGKPKAYLAPQLSPDGRQFICG